MIKLYYIVMPACAVMQTLTLALMALAVSRIGRRRKRRRRRGEKE